MEIGVSTACFYPEPTECIPEKLGRIGVTCAEVFLNSFSEYDEDYCKRLREKMDGAGVRTVSVHSFVAMHEPFLFSEYKRRAGDALCVYKKVIRAAEILGAKYHTFHGARAELLNENFDMRNFAEKLDNLADLAGEKGLMLALENVCWCTTKNPQFIADCRQYSRSENLGFTLDLKQARRANFNFLEYAKIFSDRLVNVHVSDADLTSDCLLPGCGNVDFCAVLQAFCDLGYTGDLIIEVYNNAVGSEADLSASVDYLRKTVKTREKHIK